MTKRNTYPQRGKPPAVRFAEKYVVAESGCWEWQSALGDRGYGIFWIDSRRKSAFAHRYSLEMALGAPLPRGMLVMHSCDNPKCVNPDHLSLGTNSDNLVDASQKGRIARGERNGGGGKLTEEMVREILATRGIVGCTTAARKYGVSGQTIKRIRRRQGWRHVESEARQ